MNRLQRLNDLSRRLAVASEADDWDQAAAIDREAVQALGQWRQPPRWSLAERVALAEWRDIHGDVQAQCADDARRHQSQLAALRAHRDGWMAYGMQQASDAIGLESPFSPLMAGAASVLEIGSTAARSSEPLRRGAWPRGDDAASQALTAHPEQTKAEEETP